VAALTVDPARRLADSLGIPDAGSEPQEVPAARWADSTTGSGRLTVMMMDTKRTFDDLVSRHAPNAEVRQRILDNPIYARVSSQLAGAHEYMAMEKLLSIKREAAYDLIVLDTPPTQNALDFLGAPRRLVDAIDSPFLGWLSQTLAPAGSMGSRLLVRGFSRVVGVMGHITGREFLEQLASFMVDMNGLFGGFRKRATAVAQAFRSPEFGFVLVAAPRRAATDEALDLLQRLNAEGMTVDAFVLNRCRLAPETSSSLDRQRALEAHLGQWPSARRDALSASIARAQADALKAATRDAQVISDVTTQLGALNAAAPPLLCVPELPAHLQGTDGLRRIADALAKAAASTPAQCADDPGSE
jgi:anion-transporting  ArsA/GET3 family ATPase